MNNNICENGFGATMRFIFHTAEYMKKNFFNVIDENLRKSAHLHDVMKAREMKLYMISKYQ